MELQEGDRCPHCDGEMGYVPVVNCSCHISPPCYACTENTLICLECGWNPEEDDHD